jgi:hypothetical protein
VRALVGVRHPSDDGLRSLSSQFALVWPGGKTRQLQLPGLGAVEDADFWVAARLVRPGPLASVAAPAQTTRRADRRSTAPP